MPNPDIILWSILSAIAGILIVAGGIVLIILITEAIRKHREKRFMEARLAQRRYFVSARCPVHGSLAMKGDQIARVELQGKSTISLPHCGCEHQMLLTVDPFTA